MSRVKKKLLKMKKQLDAKALREPKTKPQIRDRVNLDRVNYILNKRYDLT